MTPKSEKGQPLTRDKSTYNQLLETYFKKSSSGLRA